MVLAGLVVLGYNSYRANLNLFEELNKENLGWAAGKLQFELMVFVSALHAINGSEDPALEGRVNDRFDILWSRVALTQQGSVGERLRAYDEESAVESLFETMKAQEPAVVGIKIGDVAGHANLISAFEAHLEEMRTFDRTVFHGEQADIAGARDNLRRSAMFTGASTVAAFIFGTITLMLVARESRANMETAAKNLALAREAEAANLAKSRFLTMMSHELRTPMNGVLGMLSLTKTSGLNNNQLRLVERAERSGQQMISMLGDILDYSALQEENMQFEAKPFDPQLLAVAVEELFGAVARREGISFSVTVAPDCPRRLSGDMRRLRQIIAHFASFIVETAGTTNIAITLSHAGDNLQVEIGFDYRGIAKDGEGELAWRPDILLGIDGDSGRFASDALGPAVARGILEKMGGAVRLGSPKTDRISIYVDAPAPELPPGSKIVHIEARSESLRTICRLGLAGTGFTIADEATDPKSVTVVLMEAGPGSDPEECAVAAARFPNAMILALGDPTNPGEFDGLVPVPLDIPQLRESVERKVAG